MNYAFELLKAVEQVNANQKPHIIEKIKSNYNGNVQGKQIALQQLAFNSNIDDIREVLALSINKELTEMGASITAYDPEAMPNVKAQIGDKIKYAEIRCIALTGTEALIFATEWNEFRTPDFESMEKEIKNKIIFDSRNLFDVEQMNELACYHECI